MKRLLRLFTIAAILGVPILSQAYCIYFDKNYKNPTHDILVEVYKSERGARKGGGGDRIARNYVKPGTSTCYNWKSIMNSESTLNTPYSSVYVRLSGAELGDNITGKPIQLDTAGWVKFIVSADGKVEITEKFGIDAGKYYQATASEKQDPSKCCNYNQL